MWFLESSWFFLVRICGRKIFVGKKLTEKKFDRKNNVSKNKFSRPKKFPMKKSMKNENFEISIFSSKNQNFKFFIFHWLFHRIFLVSKNYFSKNIFSTDFFRPHISTQEIPKIPKIALRKLCNKVWSSIQLFSPLKVIQSPPGIRLT